MGADLHVSELLLPEAVTYRSEGRRYQDIGELDLAVSAYRKAIAAYPKYADAYNDLGVVLESLGKVADAEDAYQKALQLNPHLAGVHSNLALLYEKKGLIQEAAVHWGARVQMGPVNNPWVIKAREKLIQYKLPVPELPEVLAKKRKGQVRVAYETGLDHEKAKRWDLAAAQFEEVLSLDPSHERAAEHLRLVRAKMHEREQARAEAISSALHKESSWQPVGPRPQEAPKRQEPVRRREVVQPKESVPPMERAAAPAAPKKETPPPVPVKKAAAAAPLATAPAPKALEPPPVKPPEAAARQLPSVAEAKAIAEQLAREKAKARSQSIRELYQRGVTAVRQGRYEEAVVDFKHVLALDPGHAEAKQGLKRAQAALDQAQKAAEIKPSIS